MGAYDWGHGWGQIAIKRGVYSHFDHLRLEIRAYDWVTVSHGWGCLRLGIWADLRLGDKKTKTDKNKQTKNGRCLRLGDDWGGAYDWVTIG